ncbi:LANO_0E13278g1_1 [Lachancea nothofagi CBS 11611]|uniref:LANO_0E13278g1_1 n=1 Tax=Lachancea nothofagi CBS 11611 TaxID=1266666 RepID=A0A1G4JYR7_9SACH|nr:LANO_0E13278g1_1 [Lachancea nothofagi CBS 11611]
MTTYQKLVKGATKIKMAPPKAKYVDPILMGTSEPHDFREIIHALESRVMDTAWTVVYKSLILAHIMIREGEANVTIKYLSNHLEFFQLKDIFQSKLSSGDLQALRRYKDYLKCRCEQYAETGIDYVRDGNSSLKGPVADDPKKSLDRVQSLELQVTALIKNRYSQYDLGNDLLMTAFRLMVQDLLVLYNSLNEGIITLLESFFELTHQNAERTLKLYKRFVELTEIVVKYLKTGKAVGLKIPVIKHITTKLIKSLEEHLRDDANKGQTFSADDSRTPAQRELEQIREQKRLLEQQINSQQQMIISPTIPQQQTGYNPFSEGFSFEQGPVTVQPTSNPFMAQAQQQQSQVAAPQVPQTLQYQNTQPQGLQIQNTQPQGLQIQNTQGLQYQNTQPQGLQAQNTQGLQYQNTQPQGFQTQNTQGLQYQNTQMQQQQQQQQMPAQGMQYQQTQLPQVASPQAPAVQFQHAQANQQSPQLQSAHTGYYSTNTQVTPNFTGAGFGGYSSPPPAGGAAGGAAHPVQISSPTGSNNPFSLDNIAKVNDERERVNPFSQTSQNVGVGVNATGNANPFGAQPQVLNQHTFGGLENLPTVPVFPQAQQYPQQYAQQQQQQQQQQPGRHPYRGEGPNLIDI